METHKIAIEGYEYLWTGVTDIPRIVYSVYRINADFSFTLTETGVNMGLQTGVFMVAHEGIMCSHGTAGIRRIATRIPVYTPTTVTLASVVSALAIRTGLVAGDLDVTALTDTVDGYVIPRPMTARTALEQLRQAYFFDGVESDGKIKFVKRGSAYQATIPAEGLALARLTRTDYGASGVLACEALADDTVLYSSSVLGNDASVNEPQALSPVGPTQVQ